MAEPTTPPKRKFFERTGQNLWDIPELRRIFGQLKRAELEEIEKKKAKVKCVRA